MTTQSHFQKNSEYDKVLPPDIETPMFIGVVDIEGKVYDGEFFRQTEYGKEVMVLCLKQDENKAPF